MESARALNEYLYTLETQVKKNFNTTLDKGMDISASILRDIQTGKTIKDYTIKSLFEMNNKLVEQEEVCKYSRSTISRYITTFKLLKSLLNQENRCKELAITKLDLTFLRKYKIYLKTEFKIHYNTTMKQLKQ